MERPPPPFRAPVLTPPTVQLGDSGHEALAEPAAGRPAGHLRAAEPPEHLRATSRAAFCEVDQPAERPFQDPNHYGPHGVSSSVTRLRRGGRRSAITARRSRTGTSVPSRLLNQLRAVHSCRCACPYRHHIRALDSLSLMLAALRLGISHMQPQHAPLLQVVEPRTRRCRRRSPRCWHRSDRSGREVRSSGGDLRRLPDLFASHPKPLPAPRRQPAARWSAHRTASDGAALLV